MYAMNCIRTDIAYVVNKLSKFTSKPNVMHWNDIYRVLKYLIKTMHYGLNYVGYPSVLEGYSDASWNFELDDSMSTSGWIYIPKGAVISWGLRNAST